MKNSILGLVVIAVLILVALGVLVGLFSGVKAFNRYQKLADAKNQIMVNEIRIDQTAQLVEVEKQEAAIKVEEAKGIAKSQEIINSTLTDQYLTHEAISAQSKLADSPSNTTIYIPVGNNGVPLVHTTNPPSGAAKP